MSIEQATEQNMGHILNKFLDKMDSMTETRKECTEVISSLKKMAKIKEAVKEKELKWPDGKKSLGKRIKLLEDAEKGERRKEKRII